MKNTVILAAIAIFAGVIYWRIRWWNKLFDSLENELKSKGEKRDRLC